MTGQKTKTYFRRCGKVALWLFIGVVSLIILTVAALQLPMVQHSIAQRLMSSLSKKTHARIEIGSVSIALTNSVVLHDVFVESRQRDTLVFIHTLAADVNLFGLFSHNIELKNVQVDVLTAHIARTLPDSSFNFDFLLAALGSDSIASNIHPDTSSTLAWTVRLKGVDLRSVRGSYDDEVSGLKLRLRLGTLKASIDTFDLKRTQFHVNELDLSNTTVSIVQSKSSPSVESSPSHVGVGVGDVSLANIHFQYENTMTGELIGVDLGRATLSGKNIDLPAHHIEVKKFQLENTNVVVNEPQGVQSTTDKSQGTVMPWVISLDQLILSGSSARYDVDGTPKTTGVDWNHLGVNGLTIRADHLLYSQYRMGGDFSRASFREHSGLELREMSGGFKLDPLHAQLKDFRVETADSHIQLNLALDYASFDSVLSLSGAVTVKAKIDESRISIADLLLFLPSFPLKNAPGATIRLSSQVEGPVQDLHVEEFHIAAGDSTSVDLTGSIQGLPMAGTAHYNAVLHLLSSNQNDIQVIVPDTLLPEDIVLPASMSMSGSFNGTPQDFSASTDLSTSIGNLKGQVVMNSDQGSDSTSGQWKGDIIVDEFNVGSLLGDQESYGPISLTATFSGTGLNKDDIEAKLDAKVDDVFLSGYTYHGLSLKGTASPDMFEGTAEIQDTSIEFAFRGTINTSQEDPAFKFTLDLKGADLHRLHLTSDDIRIAGNLTSDISGKDIDDIHGNIDVRNLLIIKNSKRFVIDSVVFTSADNQGKKHIRIESPIFAGGLDGTIVPSDLPSVLTQFFAHYWTLPGVHTRKNLRAQDFTFHLTLRDPTTLTNIFVPELHRLSAATVKGDYSSDKQALNVSIDCPRIDYSDFTIDSLAVRLTSNADRMQATVRVASIADSTISISDLQFTGKADHDSIDVALQSTGRNGATKMLLAGVFIVAPEGYKFRFSTNGVVFQDLPWSVAPDNYILFGNGMFLAHNIEIQGKGQSLSLNSTDETNPHSPLRTEFKNLDLSTISRVVERDTGLVGGTLNGYATVQYLQNRTAFTSNLSIKDFSFDQRHVGDVTLRANNETENTYDVTMDVSGNGNQIGVRGQYRSQVGGNEMDLTCDFTKVNLASIEPFTFGNVRRLSGTMTGALHLTGTIKKPALSGELNFVNAAFVPTFLNTYLRLDNGKIELDGGGVELNSFDLTDSLGNIASLSGHVYTKDFRNYSFDLRAHTDKFLLLSKPASRDALYYGTIILNSDISIRGNQNRPQISVRAELAKGTNLTLALPESELAIEERRGIVRFVDVSNPPNSIMARRTSGMARDTAESRFSSIDLTSNITVNKDSKLRILIDPVSGDSLVIHGDATLSFSMDPSGKLTLTGRYEIVEGSYQLSFGDFIKREFVIDKGSSLTWLGSPYEADVDITAIYTVNASVLDLIQNELAGTSQEERNKYKQEVPIQVYLMMKGKLLSPDIHFRLDMAPDQRGVLNGSVYAKLNEINSQESELNNQVFALLVLGRFISQNTLAAAAGSSGLSDFARSSVSQILSAQLNRLSEQYIAGVNLNVGLESYQDYSTGNAEGRTQLQLALSKQLFDERVTVQVGGNVDLEGRRSQQNSLNSFAGDLKVMYKMTEDGRWQLEVFRQNSYEGAIDGDITKTGVGAVFNIDFDKLFGVTLQKVPEQQKK